MNNAHRASIRVPVVLSTMLAFLLLLNPMGTSDAAIIQGTVVDDVTKEPIADATVTISHADNGTLVVTLVTDASGRFEISGLSQGLYTVHIEAEGYHCSTRNIRIYPPTTYLEEDTYPFTGSMSPVSSGNGGGGEPAPTSGLYRYGIILVITLLTSLVMYSKIKRENLLKNVVRRRIYDHIKENPGAHYRAILTELDLSMGVLTYHLNRLEKGEYLRSRQDGMFRRFFVAGRKTEVRFFLSDIQESILATIRNNQGISQSKIAEGIGVSRKVVNYHVRIMAQAGLIYVEANGRETACFAPESRASDVA